MSRASKRLGQLVLLAAGLGAAAANGGTRTNARARRPHERVRRIERLALDLLALARAHPAAPPPLEVDCAAVVDQVLSSLGGVLRERGVLVFVKRMPVVHAHEAQIAAVFRDLILNAIAFAAPGGRPRLTIDAERGQGEWRFSVVDTSNDRRAQRVSSFVFTVPDAI
jgi:signal transduction histidine kinase